VEKREIFLCTTHHEISSGVSTIYKYPYKINSQSLEESSKFQIWVSLGSKQFFWPSTLIPQTLSFPLMKKCFLTVLTTTQMFRYTRAVGGAFTEIPLTNPLALFALHFPSKPGKVATAVDGVVVALQVVVYLARSKPRWHVRWTVARIGRNWIVSH